jgi:hypothetical protein
MLKSAANRLQTRAAQKPAAAVRECYSGAFIQQTVREAGGSPPAIFFEEINREKISAMFTICMLKIST